MDYRLQISSFEAGRLEPGTIHDLSFHQSEEGYPSLVVETFCYLLRRLRAIQALCARPLPIPSFLGHH